MDILFVDDNRINTALYKQVLSPMRDARAVCFADPFGALRWCQHRLPALVVVDYRMPGMDGIQFIRNFRMLRGTDKIPIIMLTAVASPVLWQTALDAGASEYFLKPIDKKRFLTSVSRLIESGRPQLLAGAAR